MDIEEKRVYGDATGRTRLAVASAAGLAIVGVSDDVVGEFGLALREPVRDLAPAGPGRLVAATGAGLRLVTIPEDGLADEATASDPVGDPATAVSTVDDDVVVTTDDGTVRRTALEALDGSADPEWTTLGEADVRAADGPLLATAEGVLRVDDTRLDHVGLDDVRDVAAAGPLAATADGCYRLGPGWTRDLDGAFDVVAADPGRANAAAEADRASAANGDRAHAAAGTDLHTRIDGEWTAAEWPDSEPPADLAYGDGVYAVSVDGTVLADAGDGWRSRSIGLPDVSACTLL